MSEHRNLMVVLDIPCMELVAAEIDEVENLIRFDFRDSSGRMLNGIQPLRSDDIELLNEGGIITLKDQTGNEIMLRL